MLPGVSNSGPGHWQSLWEAKFPAARRVWQRDWERPVCEEWVKNLDASIAACARPPVLVGHSLGCLTAVHWARTHSRVVRGALLVAPSDVERADSPSEVRGFRPIPMGRLAFPSLVVASSNDAYLDLERARLFAEAWGSRLVEVGPSGHVNADSGFGTWPRGEELLAELL